MAISEPIDFFDIEVLLEPEEIDLRNRVRSFVDEVCMPIIPRHFDKGTFPLDVIPQMAELGLFGVHVKGYGCRSMSHIAYGLVCQELGRCDSGLRALFSVQNSLVMYPIYTFGSEEQRQTWLHRMQGGDAIGCFGLSEPDYGSNPAGMTTTASRLRDHYVLNGTKMWITNGSIAHVALIWAKTTEGIRCFLVDTRTPGFKATPIHHKFGYRT